MPISCYHSVLQVTCSLKCVMFSNDIFTCIHVHMYMYLYFPLIVQIIQLCTCTLMCTCMYECIYNWKLWFIFYPNFVNIRVHVHSSKLL